MKKWLRLLLALTMVFTLLGCGQSQNENGAQTIDVYLSWSGNTGEMATYP